VIQAKKHAGLLCIQAPQIYNGEIARATYAKWSKKWNCHVAEWTSYNCAKLVDLCARLSWPLSPEVGDAGWPVIMANPELFPHITAFPAEEQPVWSLECTLDSIQGNLLKRGMWQHQKDAFRRLGWMNGAILDMGMGTGKTMTTISLIMGGKHDFGFIVCPKSVIDVWPLEFFRNSKKDFHILQRGKESISKFVKNIEKERHNAQVYKRPFVFICNYEAFWRGELGDFIQGNKFDYIVYDEVHRLKSHKGSASKFAAAIRKQADRVIGGTGTLLPHSPLDAFAIYRAVDPGVFGTHFIPFRSRYALLGGFEGKQVVGFQHQDDLHRKLKAISFRIKTEDAVELPEAQHIERFCELSPGTRKLYEEMKRDLIAEFEGHVVEAANAMVKVLRLMQCTSGVMKDTEGRELRVGSEKAELFADIMEDIATDEPVCVFCNFTMDLRAVEEVCLKQGRRVAELSGRKNELKKWQDGEADVLIVQIKAGKEGVDFTRARICFYYSIGHSLGEYLQSERRIHRPGQTRSVVYYHLLVKDSIDIDVYKALDKKHDIVLSVLDGLGLKTNNQRGIEDVEGN